MRFTSSPVLPQMTAPQALTPRPSAPGLWITAPMTTPVKRLPYGRQRLTATLPACPPGEPLGARQRPGAAAAECPHRPPKAPADRPPGSPAILHERYLRRLGAPEQGISSKGQTKLVSGNQTAILRAPAPAAPASTSSLAATPPTGSRTNVASGASSPPTNRTRPGHGQTVHSCGPTVKK